MEVIGHPIRKRGTEFGVRFHSDVPTQRRGIGDLFLSPGEEEPMPYYGGLVLLHEPWEMTFWEFTRRPGPYERVPGSALDLKYYRSILRQAYVGGKLTEKLDKRHVTLRRIQNIFRSAGMKCPPVFSREGS